MDHKTLFALAAMATVLGTLWGVGKDMVALLKGRNARRRETREDAGRGPENK